MTLTFFSFFMTLISWRTFQKWMYIDTLSGWRFTWLNSLWLQWKKFLISYNISLAFPIDILVYLHQILQNGYETCFNIRRQRCVGLQLCFSLQNTKMGKLYWFCLALTSSMGFQINSCVSIFSGLQMLTLNQTMMQIWTLLWR